MCRVQHLAPSISTAEHTMSLLMAASKFTANNVARLRAGRQDYAAHEGIELSGATIGVVGHGRIGSRVARMCAAMDMRASLRPLCGSRRTRTADLDVILTESRIITIHPLTGETRNLLGAAFARMQDGVIIVNAARGGVIDTQALVDALDSGRYAAGLDVTAPEPLDPEHTPSTATMSWSPRIASATDKGRVRMYSARREHPPGLAGERIDCVNPHVYEVLEDVPRECTKEDPGRRRRLRLDGPGPYPINPANPDLFPERKFDAELAMISDNMASRVDQAVADFGFGHGSVDWNDLIANDDIDVVVIARRTCCTSRLRSLPPKRASMCSAETGGWHTRTDRSIEAAGRPV